MKSNTDNKKNAVLIKRILIYFLLYFIIILLFRIIPVMIKHW